MEPANDCLVSLFHLKHNDRHLGQRNKQLITRQQRAAERVGDDGIWLFEGVMGVHGVGLQDAPLHSARSHAPHMAFDRDVFVGVGVAQCDVQLPVVINRGRCRQRRRYRLRLLLL